MSSAASTRPARRQPARKRVDDRPLNIWSGRRVGKRALEAAETRCDPQRDAGKTLAPPDAYVCLHFARGCCTSGPECKYRHEVPKEEDDARLPVTVDVFGRELFGSDRPDMSGVGSFMRGTHALFLGQLPDARPEQLRVCIEEEFSKYGDVSSVRVIAPKHCAFVRYRYRTQAEFAREAMFAQPLTAVGVVRCAAERRAEARQVD